ncbi:unnamed protein product [Mytilus edulis]|uniref:Uncharacterized protein n=1 Tax=Mytilus edulis TaxID=6550 RepID=A0A8S3T5C7_MYTED|nr:unnamed protein product [Mytilus edulis]
MLQLKPSEVFYSQDSISNKFGLQPPCSKQLIGITLDELLSGSITTSHIPFITVVMKNGKFYTADNRRLWVFRKAEEAGSVHEIAVNQGTNETFRTKSGTKFTTSNDGISIRIRGDPGGVIWRTFKPNVCREHNKNEFGSSSLRAQELLKSSVLNSAPNLKRNQEPSIIRMTDIINDANAATDYRRPSIYKSSYSNNIYPKLKNSSDDDSVLRNTEPLICERDTELSNMIQTKPKKEAKVCSKSCGELEYITNPLELTQFSKKEKQDHRSFVSTPKRTGVYGHARHKSYKECEKEHDENEKASDRPTQSQCNRDSLLLEENQRFKLLLSAFQLQISEVCRVKSRSNQQKISDITGELLTSLDKIHDLTIFHKM